MTKIQKLKYYIQEAKERPIHSLSQQVETTITLMRLESELEREIKLFERIGQEYY